MQLAQFHPDSEGSHRQIIIKVLHTDNIKVSISIEFVSQNIQILES